jgi:pSer/pThr/pTyr-binding forkhead associated (FHA) protein
LPRVAGESLSVTAGEAAGESVVLNGELVIGRSPPELASLARDTEVSRVHARLWRDADGTLMVEDLGSRNGTFLNGARIDDPQPIAPGDELRAGRTTMELGGAGAPTYDALVEHEHEPEHEDPIEPRPRDRAHVLWPAVAVAALLAGGGIGAAVAVALGGSRGKTRTKTDTLVITREVTRPAPRPRLAAPAGAVQLAPVPGTVARSQFVRAFCGSGSTASHGMCACTYDELTRREPYAQLVAQTSSSSAARRVAPEIASAARACGAG